MTQHEAIKKAIYIVENRPGKALFTEPELLVHNEILKQLNASMKDIKYANDFGGVAHLVRTNISNSEKNKSFPRLAYKLAIFSHCGRVSYTDRTISKQK